MLLNPNTSVMTYKKQLNGEKKQRLSDWGKMHAAYRKRTLNIRSQTGCKQWIKKDILCRPQLNENWYSYVTITQKRPMTKSTARDKKGHFVIQYIRKIKQC